MRQIKILIILLVMLGVMPIGCRYQCPSENEQYFNIRGINATNRVQPQANVLGYLADGGSVQWDQYRLQIDYDKTFFSLNLNENNWANPFVNTAYARLRRDCQPAGSAGSQETLKNIRIFTTQGIQVWDSEVDGYYTVDANTDITHLWNIYDANANGWVSLTEYLARTQTPIKEMFGMVFALNKRVKAGSFQVNVEMSLTNGEKHTDMNPVISIY